MVEDEQARGRQGQRRERRLHRQIDALARAVPWSRRTVDRLRERRMRWVRVPLGVLLILGGFVGFLPVLGFWMLPLGLFLLAIDLPLIQPSVSAASIRARRRIGAWWRRKKAS